MILEIENNLEIKKEEKNRVDILDEKWGYDIEKENDVSCSTLWTLSMEVMHMWSSSKISSSLSLWINCTQVESRN